MLRLSSRSLWLVLLMALVVSACQQEQETTAVANEAADAVADVTEAEADAAEAGAGPAPLLDREIFFGNPEIAFAALSPTGQYVAFARELDGILNVWVKGLDQPFEEAWPITNDRKRPVTAYFWSQDGKYLLFTQDKGGDENFRVYAVDPSAEVAEGEVVPPARDLTPYDSVRAFIYAVPKQDPAHILVGLNDRDLRLHDVYRINIETGERELVRENNDNVSAWVADLGGQLRLAGRIAPDGTNEVLRVTDDGLELVYSCSSMETCNPLRYHPDGEQVYMATNKGDRDLIELVLFNPATGEETLVERDPEGQVDFGNAIFSQVDDSILATSYTGDRVRIYPHDETFAKDLEVLRKKLTRGDLFFRQPTSDDSIWIVKETLDIDSGPNYLYKRDTGEISLLYRPSPRIPTEHMAEMTAVRYTARDGLEIPAYLTVPKGVEAKNLPTILLPHGGPWARSSWGWAPIAQFLANRGYAVLQPNFRGSTGYGKRFLNLGNKQWGTGTMQHDLTDAVKYLVDTGVADPERVGIMGGSYGGYATLAGVAFTPDLYAAGVSIVGPSSIVTLLNSIPEYWEPVRAMFKVRVGDMDDPEELAMLNRQSPLNSAADIKAPLMVIQGANDPRVKKSESDQIVVAMRDLGRKVEYIVAEDEGHGFANEINNLASYAAVERFLGSHLGGRYQESVAPNVQERLDKLRVDIDFLNLPGAEDADAASGR